METFRKTIQLIGCPADFNTKNLLELMQQTSKSTKTVISATVISDFELVITINKDDGTHFTLYDVFAYTQTFCTVDSVMNEIHSEKDDSDIVIQLSPTIPKSEG